MIALLIVILAAVVAFAVGMTCWAVLVHRSERTR